MPVTDVRVYTGSSWESLKGAKGDPGPTVVSADAGNVCKLGTDGRLLVVASDFDPRFVNITGDTVTGPLSVNYAAARFAVTGAGAVVQTISSTDGQGATLNLSSGTNTGQFNQTGTAFTFTNYAAAGSLRFSQAGAGTIAFFANSVNTLSLASTGITAIAPLTVGTTGATAFTLRSTDGQAVNQTMTSGTNSTTLSASGDRFTVTSPGSLSLKCQTFFEVYQGADIALQCSAAGTRLKQDTIAEKTLVVGSGVANTKQPALRLEYSAAPAAEIAPGSAGAIAWDDAYLYCCVAPNTWRRIPWQDWSGGASAGSWSTITAAAPPRRGVSYAGGLFLADPNSWSTDGDYWYLGTGGPAASTVTRTVYGKGTWVKCTAGDFSGANVPAFTSADGKAWTARTMTPLSGAGSCGIHTRALAFGGGRFVAFPTANTNTPRPVWSSDGVSWSAGSAPGGYGLLVECYGIAYSGSRFVAVFRSASGGAVASVMTSTNNGEAWTAQPIGATVALSDVAYGNGRFVAVATGLVVYHSVDGVTWSTANMPASADWEAVAFAGGRFMAVAPGTSTAAISTDGVTWSTVALPNAAAWNSVAGNGLVFVAANGGVDPARYSPVPATALYFPISASRALVPTDANATVANVSAGAAPVTLTIPLESAVPFNVGTAVTVVDSSQTAVTTIKAAAGVVLNWNGTLQGGSATTVLGGDGAEVQIPGPLSQVVMRKVAANTWKIIY